jgi:hypothetical protein
MTDKLKWKNLHARMKYQAQAWVGTRRAGPQLGLRKGSLNVSERSSLSDRI